MKQYKVSVLYKIAEKLRLDSFEVQAKNKQHAIGLAYIECKFRFPCCFVFDIQVFRDKQNDI